MTHQLAFSNNYDAVHIALLMDNQIIARHTIHKTDASKELIPALNQLLANHNCALTDIDCIIANNGPGPFTTLRVVITTVNGISYATGIPLIGVNALQAAAYEYGSEKYPAFAVLFNAFGNDLYCHITSNKTLIFEGVASIDSVIEKLSALKGLVHLIGNGAELHRSVLETALGSNIIFPEKIPAYCSIDAIAHLGLTEWHKNHKGNSQLLPYYFKKHPVQQ